MNEPWPTSNELTDALLRALDRFGGSGNVTDIDNEVIKYVKLSEAQSQVKRSGNRTEIQYRLAWIRTKAKQNGLVTKEAKRFWKITEKGRDLIKR